MLEEDLPDLLPLLRPYQRRAAYWMVQREKGDSANSSERERSQFVSPLCMPMDFLDTYSTLFYNPFRYPFSFSNDLVWFWGGQKKRIISLSILLLLYVSPSCLCLHPNSFLHIIFSGSLSLSPDYTSSYVFGGILAGKLLCFCNLIICCGI